MTDYLLQSLIVAMLIGTGAGLLGSFVILRKMALAGDALSHVALPGLALGILFNFNPFWGALVFLLMATLGIWILEFYTPLSVDTLIGIFFTVSLAIGVLIIPQQELLESLFGDIISLTKFEAIISAFFAVFLIIAILMIYKKLTLNMLSPELIRAVGAKGRVLELIFLLIFALAVAIGVRFVGALLMGSLVIIPAASAKNISKSLKAFMSLSALLGSLIAFLGTLIAFKYGVSPGPLFILVSAAFFVITLIIRRTKFRI